MSGYLAATVAAAALVARFPMALAKAARFDEDTSRLAAQAGATEAAVVVELARRAAVHPEADLEDLVVVLGAAIAEGSWP